MTTPSRSHFGSYEILELLGAGGMGVVYRARDPRLGRDVAIKVLPDVLAKDAERLARLEREARLLASLNHSGIAAIYGIQEADPAPALVMELVEGKTLAERTAAGPLPVDEVLSIARQVAEAIEYAHDRGVIHRDLKPANVKIRSDGVVKVLDFGLARALDMEAGAVSREFTQSPTITTNMTGAGVLLGTAAYMAPEQAHGKPADRRSDVWAFGALVFELLSGERAFSGETVTAVLASVLRDEPDWSLLPPVLSPKWRGLLERCLVKDPRRRMQAIGEARIALEDIATGADSTVIPVAATDVLPRRGRWSSWIPWLIAGAALAALAVGWLNKGAPAVAPVATELAIVPPPGLLIGEDTSYHPLAISPDGRTVAYTVRVEGVLKLRLRRLDRREDVEIPGADGARNLFFSPDNEWLAFFDSAHLQKVSVRGGTPVPLADALQDRLGTWLEDGTIVYSREVTEPLYRIPESGGTPVAITTLDATKRERTHRFPCALDGGPWVVFTVQTVDSPGGYDDADIDAVSVETGERRHLYKGARRAVWAPGGFLVLARESDLYATPIDPRDPRITGDPVPVLADVSGDISAGASYFSIAVNGTLAWIPGGEPERTREVGWFDRNGQWTPLPIPPGPFTEFKLSPDGTRAIVSSGPGGGASDLWLADLRTGSMNRLTHANRGGSCVWLPDGIRFAHSTPDSGGGEMIVLRRVDGAGGQHVLCRAPHPLILTSVTPDGQYIMYSDYGQRKGRLHMVAVDGGSPPVDLPAEGAGYEQAGMISPDGRWVAFVSNKTRREEVCVRHLGTPGGSWQVTTGGAGGIRWGRDGRELLFVLGETLMRVPVMTHGEEISTGQAEKLFEVPPSPIETTFRDYAYDEKNDRFLFSRPPRGVAERREIAVSLGWAGRLKERVSGGR